MKLNLFIMLFSVMQVAASVSAQNTRIDLKMKEVPIAEVFDAIEQELSIYFFYNKDEINDSHLVSVDFESSSKEEVLKYLEDELGLSYQLIGGNVIVRSQTRSLTQQERVISGKIVDANGDAMPGVTIIVKGSVIGTATDIDGYYSLSVPSTAETLIFSFVGMRDKEVLINNQSVINVKMEVDAIGLEEVVAVGYGSMRRMDISGASTTVNVTDLTDLPSADIAQSIQGRIAGVSITNNSGTPGANSKIRIRGGNSILGNNDPLIVLDGIAVNISMNDINPDDIQSIDILKDASATAIYGSRGANGVIVISTKRGKSDKPKVQISSDYTINQVANKYDLLNAADYVALNNITLTGSSADTDWQDQIFQSGMTSNTRIGVLGGNDKLKYYLSGSYVDQDGLLINTGYKKYTVRTNIDTKLSDKLDLLLNISITKNEKNNSNDLAGSKTSPIWSSLIWSPTEAVFNEDGSYNKTDQYGSIGFNPYMVANERKEDRFSTKLYGNAKVNYELLNNLTLSVVVGAEEINTEEAVFTNQFVSATTGSSRIYRNNFFWQNSNLLTYSNTFNGDHRLSLMVGYEQSQNTAKGFVAAGSNLATESVGYDNLSLNASSGISSYWNRWALRSYMSRGTYSYRDKYLLTATYRRDGSSKFQGDNEYSSFPSLALGWRLSEEAFMQGVNSVDNLKLRGSWGITGNQAINPYATLALLAPRVYSYGTSTALTGYMPSGAPNPNLKWEETTQINVGLDLSLFNGRLSATMDYFTKKTEGLLQAKALPAYNGGGSVISNIGEIENKGMELVLNGRIIDSNDFSWNATFNWSKVNNKVVSIGDEKEIFPGANYASGFLTDKVFIVRPSESLGSFYGYKFLGIWQQNEAAEAAKYGNMPGDSKYEDLNGDNIIDGSDLQIIGNAMPDFTWGLNNSWSYQNFDLNIMLEGVHGRDVLNLGYAAAGVAVGDARTITLEEANNTWSESNPNTIWPKIGSSSNTDHINSSKWIQNGSYVKFRNISLAYTLPKEKVKIGDLRVVFSAQNLITITDYKGFDPEVSSTGKSDIDQGLDLGSYPTAKSYTLGVTLDF